jgi:alpha-1,2-mannosyltransferase
MKVELTSEGAIQCAGVLAALGGICLAILVVACRLYFGRIRRKQKQNQTGIKCKSIAFFHPHCASGGGGERVLWSAILVLANMDQKRELQQRPTLKVVVYTIDPPSSNYHESVVQKVHSRFKLKIPRSLDLSFIHIGPDHERSGPTSLWRQSLHSMQLAWMALHLYCPDIYFDTTGHAFTFVVARLLAGCHVAAYVHYPTISMDMLAMVWERRPTYNNNTAISGNPLKTAVKLVYYILFSMLYGLVGSLSQLTMVNSTWTYGHISKLWRLSRKITVVYPPCDTLAFEQISLDNNKKPRELFILSIGQFRPEKDHVLQLRSFARFQRMVKEANNFDDNNEMLDVRLALLGGCRNEDDWRLVEQLRTLAAELDISDKVEFVINQPFPILKKWVAQSSVGLHTMWNEHFGIGIVECMSAGCITIAHKSGGPLLDIVKPSQLDAAEKEKNDAPVTISGYLAATEQEYASIMYEIFYELTVKQVANIHQQARKSASRFRQQVFAEAFDEALESSGLLNN